nr:NADH dehydrogenase subunit 4L [Ruditapes philippinarum]
MLSVCIFFFFLAIFMVLMEEKQFLNVLILFNLLMSGVFAFCIIFGLVSDSSVLAYLAILVMCVDVGSLVIGLSLLVSSSRSKSKSNALAHMYMYF